MTTSTLQTAFHFLNEHSQKTNNKSSVYNKINKALAYKIFFGEAKSAKRNGLESHSVHGGM
ncbi:MAG: hypothetical protein AB7D28_04315 [Candidatus Berkiella sp.]